MTEEQNRTFQDKFMLRFPDGMRDEIRKSSEASGRSMNAEIIQRLKRSLEEDSRGIDEVVELPPDVYKRLFADSVATDRSVESLAIDILRGEVTNHPTEDEYRERLNMLLSEKIEAEDKYYNAASEADLNFMMYYNKVIQISQLIDTIKNYTSNAPKEVLETFEAARLAASVELSVLELRYELSKGRYYRRNNATSKSAEE